jgi:hypothetical protein
VSPALRCPSCGAPADDNQQTCRGCHSPLPWSDVETRLSDESGHKALTHKSPGSSGWTGTTSDIDHGRFEPGAILDQRYRIIGRLGRGGMGEVYRADDLKLGQPVALKFLPESVDRDPARLTQLHTEVRMARQVSHPNVCRVYDVGEYEGHTFLSMEYVDGEDLASLLRRVGRFPPDRAIELARQICAGLAAAHDRGVVHRDLKPANIMLDGSGKIRITDFGLAGASGEIVRAGTPAYMAPEQLAGGEVTPRSDLYALGLVLYEMFTGRRALESGNLAELIAKREQAGVTLPSDVVRDLDPAIDRAIMRCLDPDPARRPQSALAVAAALPGGDPLAAALAAGETPSPEMVAAAGATSALNPIGAVTGLAVAIALLTAAVVLADRTYVTSLVPLPKPPLLLVERAREILASVGHNQPAVDSAHGFVEANFLGYLKTHPELNTPERLRSGEPATLHFWYRGSPIDMVPTGYQDRVTTTDPPMTVADMTSVVVDPDGRLVSMAIVPPQLDPPSPHNGSGGTPTAATWKPLFDAAGLNMADFTPAAPEWTPSHYADTRAAWTGPQPAIPGLPLRVEAGTYRGKVVYFLRAAAWTKPSRAATTIEEKSKVSLVSALATLAVFGMFVAAGLIARHNLRKGRGDRRGAFQIAAFVSIVAFGVWLLEAKHVPDPSLEMDRLFQGQPLWAAGLMWLLYLAVEPYVRRFWPTTVVSWSRLMARQWRDPLVGRDVLFGVALGVLIHVIDVGGTLLAHALGQSLPPRVPALDDLLGTRYVIALVGNHVFNALFNAIFCVFGMVLLKILVRREWAAVVVAILFFTFTTSRFMSETGPYAINLLTLVVFISIIVLTIERLGLLAVTVLFLVDFVIANAAVTLDTSRWFFADTTLPVIITAALACYGFYASRGGEPLFGRRLLD